MFPVFPCFNYYLNVLSTLVCLFSRPNIYHLKSINTKTTTKHMIDDNCVAQQSAYSVLYGTNLDVSGVVLVCGSDGLLLRDKVFHAGATTGDVRDYGVKLVQKGPASRLQQLRQEFLERVHMGVLFCMNDDWGSCSLSFCNEMCRVKFVQLTSTWPNIFCTFTRLYAAANSQRLKQSKNIGGLVVW